MKKYLLPMIITAIGFSQTTFAELTIGNISNQSRTTADLYVFFPSRLENSLKFPDSVLADVVGKTVGKGRVAVKNNGAAARLAVAAGNATGPFKAYAKGHEGDEKYVLWYGAYNLDKPHEQFEDTDYGYWLTDDPQTSINYEVIFAREDGTDIQPGDIQPGIYPITSIAAIYYP